MRVSHKLQESIGDHGAEAALSGQKNVNPISLLSFGAKTSFEIWSRVGDLG